MSSSIATPENAIESQPRLSRESLLPAAPEQTSSPREHHSTDGSDVAAPFKLSLTERMLFWFAKRFYRTELAHSREMKEALSDPVKFAAYRANEIHRVIQAASRYDVALAGKEVLDLGCNDGVLTEQYVRHGVRRTIGVDVDEKAVLQARTRVAAPGTEYLTFDGVHLPLADDSVDTIVSYDVFEHVADPPALLQECRRVLRPGGQMLVGTWGWRHPFAPHLWSVMPVPWAHLLYSERSLLRVCRKVYESPWYIPTMFDVDESGHRIPGRFREETIPPEYLNKYLLRDFVAAFRASGLRHRIHLEPFSTRRARWSKMLLCVPWCRELFHGYIWTVLEKV